MGLLCKNKKFKKFLVVSLFLFSISILYACFLKDKQAETTSSYDSSGCVLKVKKQQKLIIGHLNRIEHKLNQRDKQ